MRRLAFCCQDKVLSKCILIAFIILLLGGLIVTKDYGLPTDERTEITILGSNLLEYTKRIVGQDNQTYRWIKAFYKTHFSCDLNPITDSVEKDHGVCAYYLLIPFLSIIANHSYGAFSLLMHGYTFFYFYAWGFCGLRNCCQIASAQNTCILRCTNAISLPGHVCAGALQQ